MRVLTPDEIRTQCDLIGSGHYRTKVGEILRSRIQQFYPPRNISTLDYSVKYRKIRQGDGSKTLWSLGLTPYLAPIMNAIDTPGVHEVVVPKPARSGGTVVAENYALKTMEHGPFGDIMWYLAGPKEVSSYANRIFKPLFDDHEGVASKIGKGASDNTLTLKKIGGYSIELLAMSATTTTNRQGRLIVFDEPDSYSKNFASNFLEQGRQRQRMIGSLRKIYACAHPDIGWSGGIAQAWLQSSRGIFVMACADCGGHASPYPTKHWEGIPRFRLHYQASPKRTPIGERLKRAGETAGMLCPHCGSVLNDEQRKDMVAAGSYMHAGQTLDVELGIMGEMDPTFTMGFWIHALMVSQVTLPELAREVEGAREHRQRTTKTTKLKQVMVRTMGEVFEGAGESGEFDAEDLKKRAKDLANLAPDQGMVNYSMGEVPDGVLFITAQVDVGGDKFDVMLTGWDLERRRYVLDRFTLKQRLHGDGVWRQLAPTKVQADWNVLTGQVIDRILPLQRDRDYGLPVAVTVIDIKDGNATPFGIEFLRRVNNRRWLTWPKVWGIMGANTATAPELSKSGKDYNVDAHGKKIEPAIGVYNVGSWKLKEDVLNTLPISDGAPGQWYFPLDFPSSAYEEFFNEVLVEKEWVRSGDNESLDLGGYSEAARQLLDPDREKPRRTWDPIDKRPIWARPIRITPAEPDGEPATPKPPKPSIFDRIERLNQGGR